MGPTAHEEAAYEGLEKDLCALLKEYEPKFSPLIVTDAPPDVPAFAAPLRRLHPACVAREARC